MTTHVRASQEVRAHYGIVNSTEQGFYFGNGKGPVMIAEPFPSRIDDDGHRNSKSLRVCTKLPACSR